MSFLKLKSRNGELNITFRTQLRALKACRIRFASTGFRYFDDAGIVWEISNLPNFDLRRCEAKIPRQLIPFHCGQVSLAFEACLQFVDLILGEQNPRASLSLLEAKVDRRR